MKDLYIANFDKIYNTLIEAGCPKDLAYEIASEKAYPAMQEQLADRADIERKRRKENQ